MISPLVIVRNSNVKKIEVYFKNKKLFDARACFSAFLIGIIVFSGLQSTFLTIESRNYGLENVLGKEEVDAISFLSSVSENQLSPLLTISRRSMQELEFIPSQWRISYMQSLIWAAKYPEAPLTFLCNRRFPPPYVYLHERDMDALASYRADWEAGYLMQHLLQYTPEVYSNSKLKIYKVLDGVPPSSNSEIVLIIPFKDSFPSCLFAYDLLSLGKYNYTTMFDLDPNILKKDIIILPSDKSVSILNNLELEKGKKLIVLNADGYGKFSRLFFKGKNEASLSINSSIGDVYLHSPTNYSKVLTSFNKYMLGDTIEFIIDNDAEEENFTKITDDNQTTFWTTVGGIGTGTVSAPTINDDTSTKKKGNDSLKMIVGEGSYNDWYFQHNYKTAQDWSNKEFMCLYWYGSNSHQTIAIELRTERGWADSYEYTFVDDWNGWRRLVIPFNKFKATYGEPSWSTVKTVQIRSLSGGAQGTWYLDSMGVDVGKWVNVKATICNISENTSVKLFNFNGLDYTPITISINASENIPGDNLYFLDGSRADELYGENYSAVLNARKANNVYQLYLSLKMPPEDSFDSEISGLSQSKFKIELAGGQISASRIMGLKGEIKLPIEFEVKPLTVQEGVETLSWYVSGDQRKTPFVSRKMVDEGEIILVNVYPFMSTMLSNEEAKQSLYTILGNLLSITGIDLPKYNTDVISWVIDDAVPVFVFKDALLNGSVNISSNLIIFPSKMNLKRVDVKTDEQQLFLSNVTSIFVENANNVAIFTQTMKISEGRGFYASLTTNNSKIAIKGDNISISVGLADGSIINISGVNVELSIKNELLFYVREPHIRNHGESTFREAYACHSYIKELGAVGQDLFIHGNVEFSLPLSDTYSATSEFVWSGSVKRDQPIFQWDELKSLKESLPWLISTSLIFIVAYYMFNLIKQPASKPKKEIRH